MGCAHIRSRLRKLKRTVKEHEHMLDLLNAEVTVEVTKPIKEILSQWVFKLDKPVLKRLITRPNIDVIVKLDVATKKDLMRIRGIGEKNADYIIDVRESYMKGDN